MLPSGTRLGPYEVLGLIGEGGMGQVYRAADTRLDRAVAIKVMPAGLAEDRVRRERFEREARSISKLEHPNICPLYDVGQLPESAGGGLFLVMQFLEGESLAQRLSRGPLSIKDTLDAGIQIAEALAAAHRAGIVHRDLKPGNVMLTRAGARLLDFGLARTVSSAIGNDTAAAIAADRTALTTQGTLLGTLHYMAPEQLDGREVDTRADVFAFGAVLYEMVTGLKAFDAETPARVLSAILRDEPARVSTLVPVTPSGLDELIHTCLAKDPNERWQGMGDVARQLRWLQSALSSARSGAVARSTVPRSRASMRSWLAPIGAAIAGSAIGAAAIWMWPHTATTPPALHALLLPPENNYLTGGLALSPDARTLAFVTSDANGERQIWIRPLDADRAQPIEGTGGASDPFWSPSGSELAFFANDQLKRIAVGGGPATVLCDAGAGAGGSWSATGTIVFQPHQQGPLMRVAASGGRPEPATTLRADAAETHHLYPSFLPDGRHFIFYVAGKQRGLYVGEIGSPERSFLFDPDPSLPAGAAATPGVYAPSGHLLYVRDRVLMARPFDATSRSLQGDAFKIADAVDYEPPGQSAFTVSGAVLVYRPRQHLALGALMWMDRNGEGVSEIAASAAAFRQVSMSPDNRTAAVERRDAQGLSSVWTIDLESGATVRVPGEYWSGAPVWSGDGASLAYSVATDSPPNIALRRGRGTGAEQRITKAAEIQYPGAFTPDARTLLFRAFSNDTGWDLFSVAIDGGSPQRLLQTPADEIDMSLSPDGRFLAYSSNESGRTEIYVSRFPEMSNRVAVSSGGGQRPLWRGDGRELFYVASGSRLMAASVTPSGAALTVGPSSTLFEVPLFGGLYAPSRDGKRFLIAMPAPSTDVVPMELRINRLASR
ncbi:MAG TPA: protein kinase [Vicinamibacterales bacterium]|nr:protein kinase [Vicinamibacterales bacterium]